MWQQCSMQIYECRLTMYECYNNHAMDSTKPTSPDVLHEKLQKLTPANTYNATELN